MRIENTSVRKSRWQTRVDQYWDPRRLIKGGAVGKNALFAGHARGAQNWAIIASLIEICKLNRIETHSYLSDVLITITGRHKQTDIKGLLLWNYTKPV